MSTVAAIVLGVVGTAWAVAAWDIARKWLADRGAIALRAELVAYGERIDVNKKAIENLAKEVHEEITTLRAQQVGVISGMGNAAQRQGRFR